jgi:hypothetical protein
MTRSQSVLIPVAAAMLVHAVLFVVTGLWMRYGSHPDLGAASWSYQIYYDYASRAVQGEVPYRDYLVEYPILSFPLFLIPRLIVADFWRYRIAFVVEMFLFDATAICLIARHVRENEGIARVPERLGWYTLFCGSLSPLVIGRFELPPMVFAFAAARWWFLGRSALGGITAGLGALLKIFPGLVAGPALIWELSRLRLSRVRGFLAFLATLMAGSAGWFLLGGAQVLSSFQFHADRGLEIETIYGGALMAEGKFRGIDVPWVIEHKAVHLAPEWGSRFASVAAFVQMAALFVVLVQFWRTGALEGIRFSGAAVLAYLALGKVLSPQYLIWLFPFLVAIGGWTGSRARWLFLFCCLITSLIYPGPGFAQILDHHGLAIVVLNLRNLLLLAVLALLIFGPGAAQSSATGSANLAPI